MTATKPKDDYFEVGINRFVVEPHSDGVSYYCVNCGAASNFGKKASEESIHAGLSEHVCEELVGCGMPPIA